MLVEWRIDLGTVLQTILFVVAGYGLVVRNDISSKAIKRELSDMRLELKKLAEVIIMQAVQTKEIENLTSQLTMLQRTVEELRRGNGFVRGRHGIDGEYGGT